jgi:signal transduction histidine kinase/streptogramin lyase
VRARGFAEDSTGSMWVTGLDHPFRAVEHPSRSPLPTSLLQTASGGWALERDSHGNIWVATLGAGVWRIHDAATSPRIERFDRRQLSSSVVRSVLEDREGNIWVGTDRGLDRLTPSTLAARRPDLEAINRPVTAVTADQRGDIWVGTQTGLYRFTDRDGTRFDQRDGLPGVAIYSLHTDARGTLWVAGDQLGLVRRLDNGRFAAVNLPSRPPLRIVAMTSDPSGALWLCDTDMGGVFRWKDGVLTEVPEVTRVAAHSALTDRQGRVWVGLVNRILLVSQDGSKRLFGADDGLGQGRVTALFEDGTGAVWAGTNVGLSRFDDNSRRFVTLPLGQNVTAIVEDSASNLWLGVLNGIMRINRGDLERSVADPSLPLKNTVFDMADGLHGVPIWLGSPTSARGRGGHLWFVTADGLADLDPRAVHKDRISPPVRIESIVADDRRLSMLDGVALPPRTSRLQIDYTALSFTVPSKVRFRYKLEGFDSDWIDAGTRRQAFYTNLPPRNYTFRVSASNDGVTNETGSAWSFSIERAFYQTAWFRVLVIVSIGLLAWGVWRLRVRRVRDKYDLVLAERARMGREIHDTLLQSLVGVTMQFDAVSDLLEDSSESAKKELTRLRRQVEQCIREARQSILDLRSPMADTADLVTAIREMAEKLTRHTTVQFELSVKGTPRPSGARVQQQLLRIAQEAVANAIRHADASHIKLELWYDETAVSLRVADNGRGFDPDRPVFMPDDHWGLANMKERADQIGAQFRLTSTPGGGTEIETIVPSTPAASAALT